MRAALALTVLALSCSYELPPLAEVRLYVDTEIPWPAVRDYQGEVPAAAVPGRDAL